MKEKFKGGTPAAVERFTRALQLMSLKPDVEAHKMKPFGKN
jgi:hypothetical protein